MPENAGSTPKLKLRSGLSLYPSHLNALEIELTYLREIIPARFILLVDTSGQFVTAIGQYEGIDLTSLGSLLAGDLAASGEIARLTGEYQDFQLIMREGERTHIALSEAGKNLVFVVQFSKDVPLGWARRLIQKSAREIGAISARPAENDEIAEKIFPSEGLSNLFSDALDDLWKG
jgi:predicted regulator of Ras-like GTPase activity (Roadblock/LC7/MglB family)